MDESKKKIIEEKRRRLREIKEKREQRKNKIRTRVKPTSTALSSPTSSSISSTILPLSSISSMSSTILPISPKISTPTATSTLTVQTPVNINIGSSVPETYDKAVQCKLIGGSDNDEKNIAMQKELEKQKIRMAEEEEKMKIFKDQLMKDKLKYDTDNTEERTYERKDLSDNQKRKIETSPKFQNFFVNASRIVEGALNNSYDFTIDYAADDGVNEESKEEKLVRHCKLLDEKKTGSRAITSIAWSPNAKELLLTSYAGQDDRMSLEPDGTVLIWNMNTPNKPNYNFYCNSTVLTAQFHPSNSSLVIGGCRSGQVVVWDTRQKRTPVDRTNLSRGHTYPVYALRCLLVSSNNLITVSTDGMLCQWNDTNLHEPANEMDLNESFNAFQKAEEKKDEIAAVRDEITTTSFDFPGHDGSNIILGSDEGNLYKASISNQKGIQQKIDAHDAPITNVQFHPTQKNSSKNVSDLFLTSSYDWTVKLWSNKANRLLYTFESARDYVFDVQWSTVHPAVFASGDGTGKLDVWNLIANTEVPTYSIQVEKDKGAINKLRWNEAGTHLAVGMSTGIVHIYDAKEELYNASNEDCSIFYEKMNASTIHENN